MTGWRQIMWWSLAVAGGTAAVVLTVLVSAGDLESADRVASVIGAVVGMVALGMSVRAMRRAVRPDPQPVRAHGGSNAARGSINDASARDTGRASGAPVAGDGISASGGSNAAGGDISGSSAYRGS
ncbi:hypothetical protein [Streptomyces sp. NPDC007346]|uniref:hypothetical protein n=1 Tax=Streptomyces sp. NPDC007346 TaxID=3154682 RepID=UPI003451CBF6